MNRELPPERPKLTSVERARRTAIRVIRQAAAQRAQSAGATAGEQPPPAQTDGAISDDLTAAQQEALLHEIARRPLLLTNHRKRERGAEAEERKLFALPKNLPKAIRKNPNNETDPNGDKQ